MESGDDLLIGRLIKFCDEEYKNSTCDYKCVKLENNRINGADFTFSTGKHNQLQKAIIEEVTSVGPMNPKRIIEISEMTANVSAGKIFVTAFLDFKTYKRFSEELAWDTEVWIAEMPDHMIHLNGDKFLGPR